MCLKQMCYSLHAIPCITCLVFSESKYERKGGVLQVCLRVIRAVCKRIKFQGLHFAHVAVKFPAKQGNLNGSRVAISSVAFCCIRIRAQWELWLSLNGESLIRWCQSRRFPLWLFLLVSVHSQQPFTATDSHIV